MTKGDRIRSRRNELKITQEELAAKLHTTKQTISKYENNIVTNIPSDRIEEIAEALETTPAYLFGWDQAEIDAVVEVQESADFYFDSNEAELKNVMLEISSIGFSHSEIKRLQAYAHALKEAENASDELHKAFVELFTEMYKLNLTTEDVKEVYTYAQYISSKNK